MHKLGVWMGSWENPSDADDQLGAIRPEKKKKEDSRGAWGKESPVGEKMQQTKKIR